MDHYVPRSKKRSVENGLPPPACAAVAATCRTVEEFLNLIWSKKKAKTFWPFKSLQESILQQFFYILRLSPRTSKLQEYMYPKFLVKYQKFSHFKNFLTFQIAAVYFKNFKNPETPKYVVKPRNIAYQSRWKV